MAARAELLVVVVVRDAELRSVLAAQLSRAGVNLLTVDSYDPAVMERRLIRPPSVLVLDEAAAAGAPADWIERHWIEGKWRRVIVLTLDAPVPAGEPDWLIHVQHGSAASSLTELLEHWAEIDGTA